MPARAASRRRAEEGEEVMHRCEESREFYWSCQAYAVSACATVRPPMSSSIERYNAEETMVHARSLRGKERAVQRDGNVRPRRSNDATRPPKRCSSCLREVEHVQARTPCP